MSASLRRLERLAWNRRALPRAPALSRALVDEPEPFQLFLERGRKNAERFGRALLIAIRRDEHGENQIPLEAQEHVPQNQTLSAEEFRARGRLEQGWIREVARHWRQDRRGASSRQWRRGSLRMNLRKEKVKEGRANSGTPLAPQTNGMTAVLSVERLGASKRGSSLAFNVAMKCACTLRSARILVARRDREHAVVRETSSVPVRPISGCS